MEENLAKPHEGIMSRVGGWVGAGIGLLVGRYSGLSLLMPLGGAFLSGWLLKKFIKNPCEPIVLAFSVQAGQLFWLLLGGVVGKNLSPVIGDIIIIGLGLCWLIVRPGFWPILCLTLLQVFGFVVNLSSFISVDFGSSAHRSLLVHVIFRGLAIYALIFGYWQLKKDFVKKQQIEKSIGAGG